MTFIFPRGSRVSVLLRSMSLSALSISSVLRTDSLICARFIVSTSGFLLRLNKALLTFVSVRYGGNSLKKRKSVKASTPSTNKRPHMVMPDCSLRFCIMRTPRDRSYCQTSLNGRADTVPDNTLPEPFVLAVHIPTEPDKERLANQVLVRHEAPITAVVAVVAVVAHDEIFPLRHDDFRQRHVRAACRQNGMLHSTQIFRHTLHLGRKFAAGRQVRIAILLLHQGSVDIEPFIFIYNTVAGNANHALDVIDRRIAREAEYHHLTAFRAVDIQNLDIGHRQPYAIGKFVHQNEIADIETGKHRSRGDTEGFGQNRANQKHNQNDREEGARVLDSHRLFACVTGLVGLSRFRQLPGFVLPALRPEQPIERPDGPGGAQYQQHDQCKVHGYFSSTRKTARKAS